MSDPGKPISNILSTAEQYHRSIWRVLYERMPAFGESTRLKVVTPGSEWCKTFGMTITRNVVQDFLADTEVRHAWHPITSSIGPVRFLHEILNDS